MSKLKLGDHVKIKLTSKNRFAGKTGTVIRIFSNYLLIAFDKTRIDKNGKEVQEKTVARPEDVELDLTVKNDWAKIWDDN